MALLDDLGPLAKVLEEYLRASSAGAAPVVRQSPIAEVIDRLELERLVEQGGLTGQSLIEFFSRYLELSTRLHHPGSLAHQVAVPHPVAALSMLVEGVTNNPMAIYEMGPAAASIEFFVIGWLNEKIGWGALASGVFTHGGSLANLTALLAARSRFDRSVWSRGSRGDLAVIASSECHYSVARAAAVLGVGEENVYAVATDSTGRTRASDLREARARALADGKRPFVAIANACSTATGVFDPLREIGEFCRAHDLWLHVDGAHGASALLSPRHRAHLDGLELADSVTWDAHKLLRTPGPCTALLVREASSLDSAFHQDASYLFHSKEQPGFDFIGRTMECTKAALGLRLFTVLAALGKDGAASYIDDVFEVTHRAYDVLSNHLGLECPAEPESNILCFRVPGSDEEQLRIRDRLLAEGEFHLSTAVVGGRRYLRAVVTSPATSLAHLHRMGIRALEIAEAAPGENPSAVAPHCTD